MSSLLITIAVLSTLLLASVSSSASASSSAESTNARHARVFNKWLSKLDPNLKVHIKAGGDANGQAGTGLYTNTTIKKGDVVISLPLEYTLCDETLTVPPSKNGVDYFKVIANHIRRPDDRIAVAVMTERALGSASKWAPWIRVLPEPGVGLYTPHMWPQHVRDLILPTQVRESANKLARDLQVNCEGMAVPFRILKEHVRAATTNNKKKKSADELAKDFSCERYIWAHAVVTSRAWNINGKKYLVPGADMFNHDYDVEDKAYNFKRDTTIREQRSQKFTLFHQITGGGGATDKQQRVEVLSDRHNNVQNSELFESYGDSSDKIYFSYLGFVASDVETMLIASIVPPTEDVPPHLDLDVFARAWSLSTVRNRRDCLDVELHEPLPVVKAQDDPTPVSAGSIPFQTPPKPLVHFAKRLLNLGGNDGKAEASVCVHFGELHPFHYLFHFITQLPADINKQTSCLTNNVDPITRHATTTRLYPACKVMLRQLKKCLKNAYGPAMYTNVTLRAIASLTNDLAKRVLPQSFDIKERNQVQNMEANIIDDALEAHIIACRLRGVYTREKCFQGMDHILENDFAPAKNFEHNVGGAGGNEKALDVAHLMRLRYSLQQRMILMEIQRRVEVKRQRALSRRRKEEGLPPGGDDDGEGGEAGGAEDDANANDGTQFAADGMPIDPAAHDDGSVGDL